MQKKVAIISGASGNLGRAVVQYFLEKNYHVIGLVHTLSENAPTDILYQEVAVDLLNDVQVKESINQIQQQHGQIDVVVLTAGGFAMGDIANTSIQDIQYQYQLNFETAYNLAHPTLMQMQQQKNGRIFFIGSGAGMDTRKGKGVTAYSLSKSLLFQLANIINAENKDTNVKAYVIVPSIIDTPQNRASMPNADFSKWEKTESIAAIIGRYTDNTVSDKTFLVVQDEQ